MPDRLRQWVVTGSAVGMVLGTLYGFGLLGTPVAQAAGGSLSAEATLLAPAVRAFSIWSVIYVGLLGYVVWQWLPSNVASPRLRRTGGLAAASMLLNGAWLLVVQAGWLWASVAVIGALAGALGLLVRRLGPGWRADAVERVLVDGTFGLYLGWVSVATIANVAAVLVASGVRPAGDVAEAFAVGALALAAVLGVVLARVLGGRIAVALAMAWGLGWIAAGRIAGEPMSDLVGFAAAVAGLVVLTAAALVRLGGPSGRPLPVDVLH